MKTIMYAINTETGHIISRVDSDVAIPVLQYGDMQPENNFTPTYKLEKMPVFAIAGEYGMYKWTRKVPLYMKNKHREFWGMKPLKRRANSHEMTVLWEKCRFKHGGHIFTVVKVIPYTDNGDGNYNRTILNVENGDWDAVILKDERKRITEWNFGGMKFYLKENPDSVEHATMGLIREQCS